MVQADSNADESVEKSPFRRFKQEHKERTDWAIIGPRGAVHFWKFNTTSHDCGGVEEHRKEPNDYQVGEPPSQDNCFLLGCPCWHDGSSLYADKFFPILRDEGDEGIFTKLEREYFGRFPSTDDRSDDAGNSAVSMKP